MALIRRLTAIFAADAVGYSRLMGADEEGTHERLKVHLEQFVDPKIGEHRGHIIKSTGDGLLVEFASVVDAVRCAVEVQRGMIDRESEVPDERCMRFRIGVNIGDVIADGGDIFGDGVNVAARLEALSDPGGLCISGTVYDNIQGTLSYPFENGGERSVKNIARPVRVYMLPLRAVASLPVVSMQPAASTSRTTTAPRLSVVVLPFSNLSDDREQQYFADGITEDLTTDLSRIVGMFVISRNTAFTYRNRPIDTKQIGRELGVRYVLEGSVRRIGDLLRVNAQLIDAESDAHIWADGFDYGILDSSSLQNEITSRIAIALNMELISVEATRQTSRPDARDYILRGRAANLKPPSRSKYEEEIELFEHALALDPSSVEARCWLARALMGRVLDGMSDSVPADIKRAEDLADRALAASPRNPLAHYAKGQVLRAQHRYREAIPEYEAVIAADRNWVGAISALASCKLRVGPVEEIIPLQEHALRLSPHDPLIANMYGRIGSAHLLQSHIDEAIVWYERARDVNPTRDIHHAQLAAAFGLKGETRRAAAELAEAQRLSGNDRLSSISNLAAFGNFGEPQIYALVESTFFAGLRKAGMPEE
jgi:TolB-like protein/class 3 adenylate cyclase